MTTLPASGYASDNARQQGEIKQFLEDVRNFIAQMLGGSAESELTIAAGSITPTHSQHSVDTEGDAATDDLNNAAITNLPAGSYLQLRANNTARTVVVKHGAGGDGEFFLSDSADFTLDDDKKFIVFQLRGSDWYEVRRSYGSDISTFKTFLGLASALIAGTTANVSVGYTTDKHAIGNITGAHTPDFALEAVKTASITGNITINAPASANAAVAVMEATIDATGGRTLTLGTGVTIVDGAWDSTANAVNIVVMINWGSTKMDLMIKQRV